MLLSYWFVVAVAAMAWLVLWGANLPKHLRDRVVVVAFFVVYILCVCFRDISVGVDTKNYARYFDTGLVLGWDLAYYYGGSEAGFALLSDAVALFGGHELFFIVTGLISVTPIAVLYYRESENALLCCTFFLISLLFEFFFSGVRQGLAIGIGIIAFFYVQKKRPLLFLLFVTIAAFMHSSAIVMLVIYPLYHARISQQWIPFVVVAMVAINLTKDWLFSSVLLPMFGGDYLEGYSYLTGESGQGSLATLFMILAFYACIVLDPKQSDPKTLGFRNLLLLAAAIHLFTPLHPVVCRVNYYFIPYIPIALSRVNSRVKPALVPVAQVANFGLPAFFAVYFLFAKSDSLLIAPYMPYFA